MNVAIHSIVEQPIQRNVRSGLRVARTGIRFQNVAPERVQIEIEVENDWNEPSRRSSLRLEAAPFGAFVPWRPLTALSVPALPPRSSTAVRTVAVQPRARPIGAASALLWPPLPEPGVRKSTRSGGPIAAFALRSIGAVLIGRAPRTGELPPDVFDLLGNSQPHWAGNLNVWVGRKPVERHAATHLRIHPGRPNMAIFDVGSGRDEYAYRLELPGEEWGCTLHDLTASRRIEWSDGKAAVWHPVLCMHFLAFIVRPPAQCGPGAARVHVTQRSSGKTALVEFDLDPAAAGPGCFAV